MFWFIRAYSSWKSKIQYLKILEFLHLSFNKWPSLQFINSEYLLTTIMGNTADLAVVQKSQYHFFRTDISAAFI